MNIPGAIPKEIVRQREKDAWDLRLKGYTHERIAQELGLERSTITKMLNRLSKRNKSQLDEMIQEYMISQAGQLDYIIDEMLQAWQRSKEAQRSVSKKTIAGQGKFSKSNGEEMTIQTEDQDGNTRYITEARAAMSDIRKLLGLDAPTKQEYSGPNGGELVIKVKYESDNNPDDTETA